MPRAAPQGAWGGVGRQEGREAEERRSARSRSERGWRVPGRVILSSTRVRSTGGPCKVYRGPTERRPRRPGAGAVVKTATPVGPKRQR